jgi:hypothetical protein
MSPAFVAFLCTLAAFVLVTIAAVVRWASPSKRQSSRRPELSVAKPGEPSKLTDSLLLIGVAMAWYSVSMGWIGPLTIYPIYADLSHVGPQAVHTFGEGYLSRIAIVLLPMSVMFLAWGLLLWLRPRNVPERTVWAIVGLCIALIVVTPFAAGAQQQMTDQGFSEALHTRLIWTGVLRAVLFTAIGLLSLSAVRSRWTPAAER